MALKLTTLAGVEPEPGQAYEDTGDDQRPIVIRPIEWPAVAPRAATRLPAPVDATDPEFDTTEVTR